METAATIEKLKHELAEARAQLAEAEATLEAIRSGEVDALVVSGAQGEQIYTLKDADRPYRVLIEEMQQGAVTLDADGTILFANRRLTELLHIPHERLLGSALRKYVYHDDQPSYDALLSAGLAGNAEGEISIQPAGHERVPVYLAITALPLESGIAGALVTDLTAKKRHDARRLRLVEEHAARVAAEHGRALLEASEGRERARALELETLMEAVPAAVCVAHDPECRTVTGNGGLFEMLRLPHGANSALGGEEMQRSTHLKIKRDGAEIPVRELPLQLAAAQGVEVRNATIDLHFDDGTVRHVYGHATPLRNPDGSVRGAIGAFVDITDRKRAEEALKEADRRKDEFLATLAHELRNPLAPMRNALEILRLHGDREEQAAQTRLTIERQLKMLVRLVDDLLDVSRISTGKIELRMQRVDLISALNSSIDVCRPHIESCGHAVSLALPQYPLWVDADATRLAQTFANLLDNAAKYTPQGGIIRVTAGREGNCATVSIADTGIGIAPEMLGRIFDLFTQVDPSVERSFGGLGIGLTLVRRLVELHGGIIEAKSAGTGQGSEFVMRIPLAVQQQDAASAPTREDRKQAESANFRILVVDDNVDAAETLATLLELTGHDVRIAYDGPSALQAAAAQKPEVIFLDIGLPQMNGYEVAQRLRNDRQFDQTYVVALSGYGSTVDQGRSLKAGFDLHIVKPIEPDQLAAVLTSAQRRRTGQETRERRSGDSHLAA